MKLLLIEDSSYAYPPRTEKNVMFSDITLAIAIRFDSAGEKLTRELCKKHKRLYVPANPRLVTPWKLADMLSLKILEVNKSDVSINVAGNGIYTMKGEMTQEQCNAYVLEVFKRLATDKEIRVRSGGQTGFDTAGLVAACKMNWEAEGLYPKTFRIREMEAERSMNSAEAYQYIQSWL